MAKVTSAGSEIGTSVLDKTYERIAASYDAEGGGFGGAPKFPRLVVFSYLLRYCARSGVDPSLPTRLRDDYDGAQPLPNSVAALNLLRLSQMTDRQAWREKAQMLFASFGPRLKSHPEAVPQLVAALEFSFSKPQQIVIADDPASPDTRALLRVVNERFLPNRILLLADGASGQSRLAQWLPFMEGIARQKDKATACICEDYVCKLLTSGAAVVARLLDGIS